MNYHCRRSHAIARAEDRIDRFFGELRCRKVRMTLQQGSAAAETVEWGEAQRLHPIPFCANAVYFFCCVCLFEVSCFWIVCIFCIAS